MANTNRDGIKMELQTTLDELRTLRDEIRLQVHLGSMEVKERWDRDLEPRLYAMEKRAERDLGDATKKALDELRTAMTKFRDGLRN